jgi:hypothetical protein
MTKQEKIVDLISQGYSVHDVAKMVKVKPNYVYHSLWIQRKKKKASEPVNYTEQMQRVNELTDYCVNTEDRSVIEHPSHYTIGGIETWDFIEAKRLNYNLGSVVKYISRADYKGHDIQDLKKARQFLDREIARREGGEVAF